VVNIHHNRGGVYNKVMQDSIFTKIIKGEIPSIKVYEDDKTLAFMDIQPIQPGQVVVVPKTQAPYVWDLADEDYSALMSTVQKVGKKIRAAFPQKERVAINVEGLGVTDHAHVKLFPFTSAEEYHHRPDDNPKQSPEELQALADKISAA
jgi:histidine triad (HIT) family protein